MGTRKSAESPSSPKATCTDRELPEAKALHLARARVQCETREADDRADHVQRGGEPLPGRAGPSPEGAGGSAQPDADRGSELERERRRHLHHLSADPGWRADSPSEQAAHEFFDREERCEQNAEGQQDVHQVLLDAALLDRAQRHQRPPKSCPERNQDALQDLLAGRSCDSAAPAGTAPPRPGARSAVAAARHGARRSGPRTRTRCRPSSERVAHSRSPT